MAGILATAYIMLGVAKFKQVSKQVQERAAINLQQEHYERRAAADDGIPIVHGNVARLRELHGHGKLFFVPIGPQVVSLQSLADYYGSKFKIKITVLGEVTLRPASCRAKRRQCAAEDLLMDVQSAYPALADDPNAVMIALTNEDLFALSLDWDFTFSYGEGDRFGIISTRRMDPVFEGKPANQQELLASLKQMLTKYIAIAYFRLAPSHDPTSIMYQPLTPNGGADDLYESDLHPEESENGRLGEGYACLSFRYSYRNRKMTPTSPPVEECFEQEQAESPDQEILQVELNTGAFVDHSMEFGIGSTPSIQLRRGYRSDDLAPRSLGLGFDINYDAYLSSDGISKLGLIRIISPGAHYEYLLRSSPGVGFAPDMAFQNRSADDELYGPKMIWIGGHFGPKKVWEEGYFKLLYPDGAWSTYLACPANSDCYWTRYQDFQGHSLQFDRDAHRVLHRLSASDGQGIDFKVDDQERIVEAKPTKGQRTRYSYDDKGRLIEVVRIDGQITRYAYDSSGRLLNAAVLRKSGSTPHSLMANEYDQAGRVVKVEVAGQGAYQIDYLATPGNRTAKASITDPSGRVWRISLGPQNYIVRSTPILFPAWSKN